MSLKNKKIFFLFIFTLTFILISFSFVSSVAMIAPSNFTNASGTIAVNCSAGTSLNVVVNATLWVNYTGGTPSVLAWGADTSPLVNTSENQTFFSNNSVIISGLTDASSYEFWCEFENRTVVSHSFNATRNGSIGIDNTAPFVLINSFLTSNTSSRAYNVSSDVPVNVYVADATLSSGYPYANCIFNLNGTNESVSISNNWCNATNINTTGLSDGNAWLRIWVNDSAGNFALNKTYGVEIDSTNPLVEVSCSDVTVGDAFPCSCSRSDSESGMNVSRDAISSTSPENLGVPSSTGTYTYTCTIYDNSSNVYVADATYIVTSGSNTGSNEGSSTTKWFTNSISEEFFESGYRSQIGAKNRIQVQIQGQKHYIGVVSLSGEEVTVEIASDPMQVVLSAGEDVKVDVDEDGFYDVYVLLHEIVGTKADLTILKINEEIPEEKQGESINTSGEILGQEEEIPEEKNLDWLWIVLLIVVLIAIAFGGKKLFKKK
jgi:hypothetical protein